jgi:hypothetical protein
VPRSDPFAVAKTLGGNSNAPGRGGGSGGRSVGGESSAGSSFSGGRGLGGGGGGGGGGDGGGGDDGGIGSGAAKWGGRASTFVALAAHPNDELLVALTAQQELVALALGNLDALEVSTPSRQTPGDARARYAHIRAQKTWKSRENASDCVANRRRKLTRKSIRLCAPCACARALSGAMRRRRRR